MRQNTIRPSERPRERKWAPIGRSLTRLHSRGVRPGPLRAFFSTAGARDKGNGMSADHITPMRGIFHWITQPRATIRHDGKVRRLTAFGQVPDHLLDDLGIAPVEYDHAGQLYKRR